LIKCRGRDLNPRIAKEIRCQSCLRFENELIIIEALTQHMASCPVCKEEGIVVEKITVANHVKESCWPLGEEVFHFCDNPDCEVIYFTASGNRVIKKTGVKTRVTFKVKDSPRPLCYCKQVTEEDVIDAIRNGAKTFEEVKLVTGIGGGGQCKVTNPSGRCCSRNYRPFIERELKKRGYGQPSDINIVFQ